MTDVLERTTAAQREWRHVPLADRVAICLRMKDWLVAHADDIGAEISKEMGRPIAYSPNEIRRGFAERTEHMAAIAPACLADVVADPKDGFRRFIRKDPLGVVLVLAPWNYPYLASVNGVVPALLAGNSVVLKMSSQTPTVALRYAEAFAAAGLPDGVFQHVEASHDEVAELIADPRVGFVAFTGSVPGGHAVVRASTNRFVNMNLELGGKDPAYVRPDAPLEATIAELVDGSFFNSGQSCCAVERIYVHRDVFDEFVDGFVDLAGRYVLGDPLDPGTTLGPMVRVGAADFVRDQVAEAEKLGARRLVGASDLRGVPYMPPQVLVDVDHSMRVMTEESFGPVIGIMPVASDDEAIELMNDSDYGLTASIWSADVDAAIAIGDRVETGTLYLNRCDYLDPALAWTGVKDTGRGVSLSPLAYDALTRLKSFHLRTAFGD
jgi:acyl-CoA reductase-like NAD-dependent aldehyde dehydrogenase